MTAYPDDARLRGYAAQLKPVLMEQEHLDPAHADSVLTTLMLQVRIDASDRLTIVALDGTPTTVKAEVDRIRVEIPFAFAEQVVKTTPKRDLTTAAGRRAAANDEAYHKATSDGNPFKRKYWNLTHQTLIAKKDPDLARRMKEAAGGK